MRNRTPVLLILCCILIVLNLSVYAGPDNFTKGKFLWYGQQPYITVDYQKNILHIACLNGDMSAIEYRTGDLDGNFGEPEVIFPQKMVSPRIRLDQDGVPHVVAGTGMWSGKEKVFYTNKIGGVWKEPVKVMDGETDGTENTINPWLCVGPDNQAYISCQMAHKGLTGALLKIDNIDTKPMVTRKLISNDLLVSHFYFLDSEMWGITGSPFAGTPYSISQYCPKTLAPIGQTYPLGFKGRGEQIGASLDQAGDIHMAGTSFAKDRKGTGGYTSLSGLKAGKSHFEYASTNGHENGSAVPVRDRIAEDRVYVFYFNGGTEPGGGNPNLVADCAENNQVRFMRVEDGDKVNENMPVTDDPAPHGRSSRTQPAVAAHPNGGIIVVHEVCMASEDVEDIRQAPRGLMMTVVGESK